MCGCSVLFIGGDKRQLYCAKALLDMGYEVSVFGFDKEDGVCTGLMSFSSIKIAVILADVVVLPTPCIKDGLLYMPLSEEKVSVEDICRFTDKDKIIFGGFSSELLGTLTNRGYKVHNFLDDEELTVINANLTSEGTVNLIMNNSDYALNGRKVLITGYGRIGKTLSKILCNLGADVTVAVRKKSDAAWAKIGGCQSVMYKNIKSLRQYDMVINTVPAAVMDNRLFSVVHDKIIIELASSSFIDPKDNVFINATGIPGKYAPYDSGMLMSDIIHSEIGECYYD